MQCPGSLERHLWDLRWFVPLKAAGFFEDRRGGFRAARELASGSVRAHSRFLASSRCCSGGCRQGPLPRAGPEVPVT